VERESVPTDVSEVVVWWPLYWFQIYLTLFNKAMDIKIEAKNND